MGFSRDALLKIKNEIETDPASRGYAGKTSAEISELLNTPISQSPREFAPVFVNPQHIVFNTIRRNKWGALKAASDSAVANGHAEANKLVKLAELHNISINLTSSEIESIITNLVTAGVFDANDAISFRDLSRQEVLKSRSNVLSLGFISEGDVVAALATV